MFKINALFVEILCMIERQILFDQVMASDRKPYHKFCVKCVSCRVNLNPRTLNEHEGKLFCDVCYGNYFNQAEFTTDYYTGIVTPEDIER